MEPVVSVGRGSKRVKHWSVTGVVTGFGPLLAHFQIVLYIELWRLTIEIIPEEIPLSLG
jgi:hypothetical protein